MHIKRGRVYLKNCLYRFRDKNSRSSFLSFLPHKRQSDYMALKMVNKTDLKGGYIPFTMEYTIWIQFLGSYATKYFPLQRLSKHGHCTKQYSLTSGPNKLLPWMVRDCITVHLEVQDCVLKPLVVCSYSTVVGLHVLKLLLIRWLMHFHWQTYENIQ